MSCKDKKCSCPAIEPGYCDLVENMAWPEFCAKCKQQPEKIKNRIDRAKSSLFRPRIRFKKLDKELAEKILSYCGVTCGGPPGQACVITPCKIRGGSIKECPLKKWKIEDSDFKILFTEVEKIV